MEAVPLRFRAQGKPDWGRYIKKLTSESDFSLLDVLDPDDPEDMELLAEMFGPREGPVEDLIGPECSECGRIDLVDDKGNLVCYSCRGIRGSGSGKGGY